MNHPAGPGADRSHQHTHNHSLSAVPLHLSPVARRTVIATLTVLGIAAIVGLVVLWPSGGTHPIPPQFRAADGGPVHTETAEITHQSRGQCLSQFAGATQDTPDIPITGSGTGPCIDSVARLTSGNDKGRYTLIEVPTNRAQSGTGPDSATSTLGAPDDPQPGQPALHDGDGVRLSTVPGPDGAARYTFFDFQRGTPTIVWAVLFVLAIGLVAAWRGLRSVLGLVFAFAVLGVFTLPAILGGESPVAVAIVSSATILFVVLYLAHGLSLRTSSALLGTLTSLVLAGLLSWAAIGTMHLTGLSGDQTTSLQVYQGSISITGLLLAGFIIGTLGVLNDVTITQASAVFELAAAGGDSRLATFRAAMRVGRDHIASTVYTLVFAYAGSALPLLLLFSVARQPFGSLLTTDAIAVELARSFVGGIAIALSVPLTTAIAAALATGSGARQAAVGAGAGGAAHVTAGQALRERISRTGRDVSAASDRAAAPIASPKPPTSPAQSPSSTPPTSSTPPAPAPRRGSGRHSMPDS